MIFAFQIGFLEVKWVDIIDIGLVAMLLFQVYKLMRGSVAIRIFLGFLLLYLAFLVVRAAQMELLSVILGQFMGVGVIAVIILFQQEIRKFLLLIGKTTIFDRENIGRTFSSFWSKSPIQSNLNTTSIVEAAKALGGANIGSLIVLSKNSGLKFYAESGDELDALVSKRLFMAIFNKNSPLHDGAVIVYNNRIVAARAILPVTEQQDLPAQFGLRHRAAIGMSEVTDTLILITSEETGQLSAARNGEIFYNLSPQELRKKINEYMSERRKTLTEVTKAPPKVAAPEPQTPVVEESNTSV